MLIRTFRPSVRTVRRSAAHGRPAARSIVLSIALLVGAAQSAAVAQEYVTTGLFFGRIEEGARIFTPARLLPFDHPEALGHEFPTVQQFHTSEVDLLIWLGDQQGWALATTLTRYPTWPDSVWRYHPFEPLPGPSDSTPVFRRAAHEAPLPGLRAIAFYGDQATAFIVDTRGLTLEQRGMERATAMGLDVGREELLRALDRARPTDPPSGLYAVIFVE